MFPTVSVIIPNYNHARYLPRRIESVLGQTFQDIEIILMDDCSTDDSRSVIAKYASIDNRIRVVLNEKNSGNTFKQWNKGIDLANGSYIWIAESDDYAHAELLASLVSLMESNKDIGLAYCDSIVIDSQEKHLDEIKVELNKNLDTSLWNEDFLMRGSVFAREYMSFANVIPNASAVLLRRSVLTKVGFANVELRLAGDWLYWNALLKVSDIAYNHNAFNYFRTHESSVRSNTLKNGVLLEETSKVMLDLKLAFPDEPYNYKAIKRMYSDWILNYKAGNLSFELNLTIANNISKLLGGKSIFLRDFFNYVTDDKLRGLKNFFKKIIK